MTVEGAKRLKAELHRLKTVDRPTVIAAIAEARSHGDLAENADYDAAKERQGFIEGAHCRGRAAARACAGDQSGGDRRRRPHRVPERPSSSRMSRRKIT
mgnify:CR=1 FL=1